ncbi:hypothetical protein SBRCBS47491_001744 [Sporothrix bragantina]|uniref:Uncharacterized protein n=1 Tax=Sporothrix bragantina TaxID=671064 RepID=A0ABP0B186_9PEZI
MPFLILPMHNKYGPVVRIAPDQLSCIDTAAWRDIYGRRNDLSSNLTTKEEDGDDELAKDPRFYHIDGVNELILSESRANHAKLCRQLQPGFSNRAMREQAPMIERYVTLPVKRLREIAVASGKQPWIHALLAVYTGPLVVFCKLTEITGWVFPVLVRLFPGMAAHNQGGIDKIKRRMALPERRPDLIQGLVEKNAHGWGHNLAIQQISGTAGIVVLVGEETTTKLMTATTYFLLKHPEALARATAEVRSAFARCMLEALQPFSVGPRNCIGRNLAFAEARLVLAQVLFNFEMALAEPADSEWLDQKTCVIWDTPAMRVFLKEATHATND